MRVWRGVCVTNINEKKKPMNLKESKGKYMGVCRGIKRRGKIM